MTIGFFLFDQDKNVLCAKFTENWKRLEFVDVNADIEMLQCFAKEIEDIARCSEAGALVKQMEDSFSNQLQISPASTVLAESAAVAASQLAEEHLLHPAIRAN